MQMYNREGDQITTSNHPKHTFHVGSQLGKGIKINEINKGEMPREHRTVYYYYKPTFKKKFFFFFFLTVLC